MMDSDSGNIIVDPLTAIGQSSEKLPEISLFFHRACCHHTLFKTQLMPSTLKYTLKNAITPLKH